MVLMSSSSKLVVLLELAVPWEDRMEEAQERKKSKYVELVAECRRNGRKARCEPIEVGCRGFIGKCLHRVLGLLEICGLHRRRATKNIMEAAEKVSWWLWVRRRRRGVVRYLNKSRGMITPGWVARVRVYD